MRKQFATIVVASSLLSFIHSEPEGEKTLFARQAVSPATPVLIGYYLNSFSDAQPPGASTMWSGYTDLVYFGARPMQKFQFTFGSDADNQRAQNNMLQFVQTTQSNNIRALFGLGGQQGSTLFSYYFQSSGKIKLFVRNLVSLAQSYQFQGVALSWEFPNEAGIGCNTHDPGDIVNLGAFAQEFKNQWSNGRLIIRTNLNGFLGAAKGAATGDETKMLVKYADYIDIIAYDAVTGNSASKMTGPVSPLTSQCGGVASTNGIKEIIQILQQQGFPTQKLILGFTSYGRLFYLTQNYNSKLGIFQPAYGLAPPGGWTDNAQGTLDACGNTRGYEGIYLDNEIVSNGWLSADGQVAGSGLTKGWDDCSKQPYLYNDQYMLIYDDAQSSQDKSAYAKSQNLGGISIFQTVGINPPFMDAARAPWANPIPPTPGTNP